LDAAVRKTGMLTLLLVVPLLASCGGGGEKRYKVPSSSMEPTIKQGSTVTARTVKAGEYRPADGDLVLIRMPASWGNTGSGQMLIRRVVGVAGESIECCEGTYGGIKRDGTAVDEPYLSKQGAKKPFPLVKVPAGQIYVMEDERGSGNDSAQSGTLPVDAVVGVVKQ
jgi:signal peptidase I